MCVSRDVLVCRLSHTSSAVVRAYLLDFSGQRGVVKQQTSPDSEETENFALLTFTLKAQHPV